MKRLSFKKNQKFNTNYYHDSSFVNESSNLLSQSITSNSIASGSSSVGENDCQDSANSQENDPTDELKYYSNEKSFKTTNLSSSSKFILENQSNSDDDENSSSSSDNNDDDEEKEIKADDVVNIELSDLNQNKIIEESFMDKFDKDYDGQVELIADNATSLISNGSFLNCGLYQFLSFLFISITWTIGNGWYAYVSVFYGYTPLFECDYKSMGLNLTQHPEDIECSALNVITNETITCTKWIYDKSQLVSTLITEYDLVCDRNYFFELAYSFEQIGYIVGTLIFSYLADKIGRKPVFVSVIISMSILGIIQYFIVDMFVYFFIGFIINSLACGLEAVCVTLVLEMFSTSKRTIFGIGIEVVWVIVLASMSPLAYFIKTWREIRLAIFIVLSILAIGSHWMVQESIRWLISVEKLDKANEIVTKIAKYNNLTNSQKSQFNQNQSNLKSMFNELSSYNQVQIDKSKSISIDTHKRESSQVIDIVKHPKFRLYVLIMALNWFATSLVYDGLTYLNNYVGENIFFNWIVMNMIELPAQFACYIIISRYGRRLTTSITLIIAGVVLLITCLDVIDVVAEQEWLKLVLFIIAKFVVTQSYSAVILHAPELFPTNLRSFGYGISLFSGKVTACISPMISFYLVKIYPILPSLIYGIISILCGFISLYVPETLNRPLPNSIEDVIKWPRTLTNEEWKAVELLNKQEFDTSKLIECIETKMCCRKRKSDELEPSLKDKTNILRSSLLLINIDKNSKIIESIDHSSTLSSSSAY